MKKIRTMLLSTVILLLAIPAVVFAATGNKYKTGAVLPSYKNIVTINVDPLNFDKSFLKALEEAGEKANRTTQYKIVIPPGSYTIGHQYRVPGNTHIYAKGAKIDADGTRTVVLAGFSDKKSENIMIQGGCWSTLKQKKGTILGAPFRFIGVRNLIFKDMEIKTNRKGHIIEVADIYGLTIEGCRISGNNLDSREPYLNVQPKEAIQLDVATESAMPGYDTTSNMYTGKGCHKVLIKKNILTNCARGIGSHSGKNGVEKNPYTYITVTGNTIKNCLGEAVYAQDWRDSTISHNTITKCRQAALFLLNTYNIRVSRNKAADVSRYSGARKNTYDSKRIYGNGLLVRNSRNLYIDYNQFSKVYRAGVVQEFSSQNTLKGNKTTGIRR